MPDWKRGIRENLDLCGLEPARQSEIVEDLAQQLDDAYRDGLARGMSDDQATAFAWSQCPDWPGLSRELRQSRRGAVGVMGRLEGRAYDAEAGGSRWSAWATVAQDLMFAVRMMRKAPAFTAAAVLTLALGIGANSTIFSVMSATFLKPLPFPDPDRLALIWETPARGVRRHQHRHGTALLGLAAAEPHVRAHGALRLGGQGVQPRRRPARCTKPSRSPACVSRRTSSPCSG